LKNTCYGNFFELDNTKCKIDSLDKESEKLRRASAKYINEYELVKVICKKKVISRAYFKLYELIYFEDIINLHVLDCFFICEAPGGFIECLTDIRRKRNLRTSYVSISANSEIKYDSYLDSDNLLYGDITKIDVIDNSIKEVLSRFPNNLDFITADGGFNVKIFNSQEIISNKLILCEIYIALNTQKKNGMFIIKYFDMFTHNSVMSYLILCTFYKEVKIIKPKTSRNCNSERYLVCSSFVGINKSNNKIITDLREIIKNYVFVEPINSGIYTLIYPYFNFDLIPGIKNEIKDFNQHIIEQQVQSINDSIRMVNLRNIYFQNLLLNLFTDNNINLDSIFSYKSILYTRIIKCIDWLRIYKINTNQIVYRFN
jgi:23S rRNA U2552 (ribose-2'-O)-methylase RlmE/FtsJ